MFLTKLATHNLKHLSNKKGREKFKNKKREAVKIVIQTSKVCFGITHAAHQRSASFDGEGEN